MDSCHGRFFLHSMSNYSFLNLTTELRVTHEIMCHAFCDWLSIFPHNACELSVAIAALRRDVRFEITCLMEVTICKVVASNRKKNKMLEGLSLSVLE